MGEMYNLRAKRRGHRKGLYKKNTKKLCVLGNLLQGGVLGVVGGAVYLVTILALRLPEATEVVGMVRRRILRRRGTR